MAKLNLPQLIEDLNTGHPIALAFISRIDIAFEDLIANMSKEQHDFTEDDVAMYYNAIYEEPKEYTHTSRALYHILSRNPTDSKRIGSLTEEEKIDITNFLIGYQEVKTYKEDPVDVIIDILIDMGQDNEDYQPPRKEDYSPVK